MMLVILCREIASAWRFSGRPATKIAH